MIEFTKRTGRLLTLRFMPPVTEQEYDRFDAESSMVVQAAPGHVVFCTDLRGATVLTDKVAARIVESMRRNSPKIKRVGVVLPAESAILSLQIERILREAGNPARRAFRQVQEVKAWLGEVLFGAENEALSAFLAESVPAKGLVSASGGSPGGNLASASSTSPGIDRPSSTGDRSSSTGDRSSSSGDRSSNTGDRSSNTGDRPSNTGDRPSNTGDRPSNTGDRPIVPRERPSSTGSKPGSPGAKPDIRKKG